MHLCRQELAGSREGLGCIYQFGAPRNIIEQCSEWNVPLLTNFIVLERELDSAHPESLWKILRAYGLPLTCKIVIIIWKSYEHFE